jgi:Domain of unknown function (DUF4350)
MRERLLVLVLAAGALGLFAAMLLPKPPPASRAAARPLSDESRPDGYLAVWRWLSAERIPEVSLRYRYDRLPALPARPTGNLLLVTLPQSVPIRAAELAALERWVERGNTLLVMAALDDTPPWSLGADPLLPEHLDRLTGMKLSERAHTRAPSATSPSNGWLTLAPLGPHPLLAGVSRITARSRLPTRRWQRIPEDGQVPLVLAARTDDGDPALWLERRGAGQIILCAAGSAFSNAAVAFTGNATLLANILSWSLGPGGVVIFDDAHQGETAFYDARAFFADPRLHHTLGWIVLLWLAFVLGPLPLRAARRAWHPLGEAAYVEASARYLAAVVPPDEAAARLIERFLDDLRSHHNLGRSADIWQWLDAQAGVSASQRRALQAYETRARAGGRVDLAALQNLLAQLRRTLE